MHVGSVLCSAKSISDIRKNVVFTATVVGCSILVTVSFYDKDHYNLGCVAGNFWQTLYNVGTFNQG